MHLITTQNVSALYLVVRAFSRAYSMYLVTFPKLTYSVFVLSRSVSELPLTEDLLATGQPQPSGFLLPTQAVLALIAACDAQST